MDDVEYLKMLRDAISAGAITVSLDLKKLEHIDSPISLQADSNRWIYGMIAAIGTAAWFGGLWWAIGAAAVAAGGWLAIGRPWHRRRMERRFYNLALQNTDVWKKLWRLRGIVLSDMTSGAQTASPEGNWRAFAVAVASRGGRNPERDERPGDSRDNV